jgi:xanthine dehydrogenase YagS FAD-binding subunit
MYPFGYIRAENVETAVRSAAEPDSEFIAGGTDMLQLMKDGVRRPAHLIDLSALPLASIANGPDGLRLGALARMSDVADDPAVREGYPVISQALLASASPQVRNMGTIGGNLLQRTRCPYFRDVGTACNRRAPGSGCSAIKGENRIQAVLGTSEHCVATHPSDLAVALVALDAAVLVRGPAGPRRIPVEAFHLLPGDTPEKETALQPGEMIVAVEVPAAAAARRSHYRKVRDRASFEFALASAAVALEFDGDRIRAARVALGGVGTKPWRSHEAEAALSGQRAEAQIFAAAAAQALAAAKPLKQNAFKIDLAQRTLVRALTTLSQGA